MAQTQLFDQDLITVGLGSLVAIIGGGMVANSLRNTPVGNWSKEITGAGLLIGGSMLVSQGDDNMKNLGTGIGSAGVTIAGQSIYQRFTGGQQLLQPQLNGSSAGNNSGMIEPQLVQSEPINQNNNNGAYNII